MRSQSHARHRRARRPRIVASISIAAVALVSLLPLPRLPRGAEAQEPVPRILEQDSTLNNLVDPPGYETGEPGELGAVRKIGDGPRAMILVPGLGFGGDVFEDLVEGWPDAFTTYSVTLPGFGGTPAPPGPPEGTSFGEQTWTEGALSGLKELLDSEGLDDVVVVGHWLTGTQLALRLAMERPDRVSRVVLLAGSARWVAATPNPSSPDDVPLARRVAGVDEQLAPRWFRTVTRETWDDNNFLPGDYAANPVLGLCLWREAARPPLHAWVRYLCEFFARDITLELDELATPTLLLRPGLEGAYHEEGQDYLRAYTWRSWGDLPDRHPSIEAPTLPETRVVPWVDRPELVRSAILEFVGGS